MKSDAQMLSDVVVIGYGTQRKSDLTGSVSNVSSKDFNSGLISSPEQLINGKVSGVQIMSNSGSPTAGSTIRIRGGASLNASNDPLQIYRLNHAYAHRKYDYPERCFVHRYLRFACIKRCHNHYYQERHYRSYKGKSYYYQFNTNPYKND